MEVPRRTVLIGAGAVAGAVGGAALATRESSDPYESSVWVSNDRGSPVAVELGLSNLDRSEVLLEESFRLTSGENFRERGVLSKGTGYHVSVRAGEMTTEQEFRTYGHGFEAGFVVKRSEFRTLIAHHD